MPTTTEPPMSAPCPPTSPSAPSPPTASSSTSSRPAPRARSSCSPTASPSSPTRGATRSRPSPPPATASSPPTSGATAGSSRPEAIEDYDIVHLTDDLLGLLDDARRGAGGVRRPRLGLDGRVAAGAARTPSASPASCGMSVPFLPRGPMPPVADDARRSSATPSSTSSTSRSPAWPTPSSARDPAAHDAPHARRRSRCPSDRRRRPAGHGRRRRPGLRRPHPRARRPARLAHPGRARPLRRRVHPHRLHRRHQLVPQLRPQLGAHRRSSPAPRSTVPSLFIGGAARPGAHHEPRPTARTAGSTDHRGTVLVDGAGHWVQQENARPRSTPPCSTSSTELDVKGTTDARTAGP